MKTYKIYIDDMGSYSTNASSLEDLTWHVNNARDHDGLPHVSKDKVRRSIIAESELIRNYNQQTPG